MSAPSVGILPGDALAVLSASPDESVQCAVTSPPYWGLRDYGVDGQIGLEEQPDLYVQRLVGVFSEVRRVLRPDGTLWLNLGDSYACGGSGSRDPDRWPKQSRNDHVPVHAKKQTGLKPKDLIGIPWRVALALQADGWYLRCDVIWNKSSAMPESVRDRPTRCHEYLFLLTRSEQYYYDADAIMEPFQTADKENYPRRARVNGRGRQAYNQAMMGQPQPDKSGGFPTARSGRNRRSVWTINPQPYAGAHFAVFPPALVEPCILAGTPAGGSCLACGAPSVRITERGAPDVEWQRSCGGDAHGAYHGQATKDYAAAGAQNASETKARILAGMRPRITVGWKLPCACAAGTRPAVVLDPFAGSGTTGEVALSLGRSALLVELNPTYCDLIRQRLDQVQPPLLCPEAL